MLYKLKKTAANQLPNQIRTMFIIILEVLLFAICFTCDTSSSPVVQMTYVTSYHKSFNFANN